MIFLDELHASLFITTIYCIATFPFCKSVFICSYLFPTLTYNREIKHNIKLCKVIL